MDIIGTGDIHGFCRPDYSIAGRWTGDESVREHPILMSGPMVRATMNGLETETRRVVKPQPHSMCSHASYLKEIDRWVFGDNTGRTFKCPYGKPGDRLWVRETFFFRPDPYLALYRAFDIDNRLPALSPDIEGFRWKPSIHMPRTAARLFLDVQEIRIEPLQDITDEGIQAEGIVFDKKLKAPRIDDNIYPSLRAAWIDLWDSINAKRGYPWSSNPWVWVVKYEVVE